MTTSVEALCYVFGIVAAGQHLPSVEQNGPAEALRLIEADDLAAVVGTPPDDRPLGRAVDLLAHDRVLGAFVNAGTTVLPMRFGAVLADETAVVEDILAARRDELLAELARIEGRVQFTLGVRYEQDVALREVLSAHPEIAGLRSQEQEAGPESFDRRIRLGEMVVRALDEMRSRDVELILGEVGDVVDLHVHEPASPEDVLNAAVLVERDRTASFERGVETIARHHHPRMRIRLTGPSPAYDFVGDS